MSQLTVGVIGMGAFGSRVAMRILWSGFPLQVYDIADIATRQFTNDFGGMTAGSPRMMAQACDVIILALRGVPELREVCFGWESLLKGARPGIVAIDLGSTDAVEAVKIAAALKERGLDYIDAPATGTPVEAKQGKLNLVVGGDQAAFERAKPVLDVLAEKVVRAGAVGSAHAASAVADYLRAVDVLAASEALRIGAAFGFEGTAILDAAEQLARGQTRDAIRTEVVTRRFETGFKLGIVRRNLALAADLADQKGQGAPLLDATNAIWLAAEKGIGWGADYTEMINWLGTLPARTPPQVETPETPPEADAAA